MVRIAVFVSGGGTNLEAIFKAKEQGKIPHGEIVLVLSSNPNAYALERARKRNVPTAVISRRDFASGEEFNRAILAEMKRERIDLIVLAGYLSILGSELIEAYPRRILNVHPALIPSFCGRGYYGLRVHEAALAKGVKVTGATVHFVNEIPDGGEIIAQKAVDVLEGDTPETLQRRVMEQAEWVLLPAAVEQVSAQIEAERSGR